MERILVVNYLTKTKRYQLQGRDFIVAPLTMIVPGVLEGNKGPLLYPEDEVRKDPDAWNGKPIVVYHPTYEGQPISARNPYVADTSEIGRVYNARAKKKLQADGWFDVEAMRRVDPRVLNSLESGATIELSTGLHVRKKIPAPPGAVFNGRGYIATARDYMPDHLAVLPDQVGACSLADGCGVLVNSKSLKASPGRIDWNPVNPSIWHAPTSLVSNCRCEEEGWAPLVTHVQLSFDQIQYRVGEAFYEANPNRFDSVTGMPLPTPYVVEVFDGYLIYKEDGQYHRQSYSIDKDGKVTLEADAQPVTKQVKYVPIKS